MIRRLGSAIHRYPDSSKNVIDVDLMPKTYTGFPLSISDRDSGDHWYDIGISGAGQARRLAELLNRAADRLEKRGQP